LEHSRSKDDLINILGHLVAWLNTPEQDDIRRAFTAWLVKSMLPARYPELDDLPPMDDLYEVQSMLAEQVKEWREQWKKEGLQESREEGLQQGMTQGMERGKLKKAQAIAKNLLKFSQMDDVTIAEVTELSTAEVKRLRGELVQDETKPSNHADKSS